MIPILKSVQVYNVLFCIQVAAKGTGAIEVENPNRVQNKLKKADDITVGDETVKPELSRRERLVYI